MWLVLYHGEIFIIFISTFLLAQVTFNKRVSFVFDLFCPYNFNYLYKDQCQDFSKTFVLSKTKTK